MNDDKDMVILDPGHKYQLISLDVKDHQDSSKYDNIITHVRRTGFKYPGNVNKMYPKTYPGVTMQKIQRIQLNRLEYVDKQGSCIENKIIHFLWKLSNWLLEFRAARHNKILYLRILDFAYKAKMCGICSHTVCNHQK